MSEEPGIKLRLPVILVGAVALLAAGAGGAYWAVRPEAGTPVTSLELKSDARPAPNAAAPAPAAAPDAPIRDVVVSLEQSAVDSAGIAVAPVALGGGKAAGLRLPGVVEPNAYRQIAVTSLVAGRITRILAELGQQVQQGQTMAEVFSPELAEAHTRYASARAELGAHERELQRTEQLVGIGAASKQELERIHAQHTSIIAAVQSARSKLELLGVPPSALDAPGNAVAASATVPAPMTGIVTERLANVGLNVDPSTRLFSVTDLSTVWVVADLYERDFSRVRVGTPTTVTTTAYPDLALFGRVSYIDPQVSPETRTAKLRVEVPNSRHALRLGMYADVQVAGATSAPVPVVPRRAVQNLGNRQVVYLAGASQPRQYTEREVRLGTVSGDVVEILSGVQPGDLVVTEGSFYVRAELERRGLRTPAAPPPPQDARRAQGGPAETGAGLQTARVTISERGFEPPTLHLRGGTPARITFVRTTEKTCGTELVWKSLNLTRPLPLNEDVLIEFTPQAPGPVDFACGMNMLRGTVSVN